MIFRKPIVTVIGGTKVQKSTIDIPKEVGIELAKSGVHLLTGGGGGVMRSVSKSYVNQSPRVGTCIGVIPGLVHHIGSKTGLRYENPKPDRYPNKFVEIPIITHLPGEKEDPYSKESRNHINVLTADIVIALAGTAGTEAEFYLAQLYNKPIIVWLEENQHIGDLRTEYFKSGEGANATLVDTLEAFQDLLKNVLAECEQKRISC